MSKMNFRDRSRTLTDLKNRNQELNNRIHDKLETIQHQEQLLRQKERIIRRMNDQFEEIKRRHENARRVLQSNWAEQYGEHSDMYVTQTGLDLVDFETLPRKELVSIAQQLYEIQCDAEEELAMINIKFYNE